MTQNPVLHIHPGMTVLDVVSACQDTIAVFESFDEQAGECICCTSLFMTLHDVALKYAIHLPMFVAALEKAIANEKK
ncbi:MAG: hypothetical protein KKE62_04165 [Proteobacteria bacterium]|nr:hypothetical protein [Pseudomonadota bacterium]MBU1387955.1 hypothetical protein [Pseudomonadota bacterium]MBU1542018.1 hypothetical protein [Pseudomonadota bacterium]MBU2430966.1 hypothetical protein [Pseudomonadota bacterium]MBU2481118.1 hypothetical protein [Pseudomonadota bacterium]